MEYRKNAYWQYNDDDLRGQCRQKLKQKIFLDILFATVSILSYKQLFTTCIDIMYQKPQEEKYNIFAVYCGLPI